jgi:hypothetical protein
MTTALATAITRGGARMSVRSVIRKLTAIRLSTESLLDAGTAAKLNVQYIGSAESGILPARAELDAPAGLTSARETSHRL